VDEFYTPSKNFHPKQSEDLDNLLFGILETMAWEDKKPGLQVDSQELDCKKEYKNFYVGGNNLLEPVMINFVFLTCIYCYTSVPRDKA
jgi:hypothetical protein